MVERNEDVLSALQYINIQAYRVTERLHGRRINLADAMAEALPCGGCGAPKGYFCLSVVAEDGITPYYPTRMTCQGIVGSRNPRTAKAFSRAAEEIQAREKAERERLRNH